MRCTATRITLGTPELSLSLSPLQGIFEQGTVMQEILHNFGKYCHEH